MMIGTANSSVKLYVLLGIVLGILVMMAFLIWRDSRELDALKSTGLGITPSTNETADSRTPVAQPAVRESITKSKPREETSAPKPNAGSNRVKPVRRRNPNMRNYEGLFEQAPDIEETDSGASSNSE
jgi:hypothetical protein